MIISEDVRVVKQTSYTCGEVRQRCTQSKHCKSDLAFGDAKKAMLEAIAILTVGCTVILKRKGLQIGNATTGHVWEELDKINI